MNLVKKLAVVVVILIAINILLIAAGTVGAVAWGYSKGLLTKDKLAEYKKIAFPEPPAPATQPSNDPTTQPLMKFDEILSMTAGKTAAEQLEFMRQSFDQQQALLSRQRQELLDLRRQVELARAQVIKDRADLEAKAKAVAAREKALVDQATDKGFADSLKMYNALPTKQVKDLFAKLDDATVVRYLQAMDARRASRILGEFKSPEELTRAQALLERMRKNDASPEANGASPTPNSPAAKSAQANSNAGG
ncbi:MAG: hypothetical protein QM770_07880 [Tepidisphaeraceae bacterium]